MEEIPPVCFFQENVAGPVIPVPDSKSFFFFFGFLDQVSN